MWYTMLLIESEIRVVEKRLNNAFKRRHLVKTPIISIYSIISDLKDLRNSLELLKDACKR